MRGYTGRRFLHVRGDTHGVTFEVLQRHYITAREICQAIRKKIFEIVAQVSCLCG